MVLEELTIDIEPGTNRLLGRGLTFGCSCCVQSVEVQASDIISQLRETQAMYLRKAQRLQSAADALEKIGERKVSRSLVRINRAEKAWDRLQHAVSSQRDDSGGTWGQELLAKYGIEKLQTTFDRLNARITEEDKELARMVGWRPPSFTPKE